jgi:phosphatidylglycerol:prolipoprotein diacylglycerol transferase
VFIDPVAFRIGPIAIHWYGIIFAVAAVAAAWLATREARRRGEDGDRVWTLLLVAAVGGIIGSRIYHVIHEWEFYSQNPALIPQVWLGGLGIPGGVAGGLVALAIYTRVQGLRFWRWIDIAAPSMLLAQAIGRLGNFVNQELYGPPTDLPWGIPIDGEHRVPPWTDLDQYPVETTHFHPLFLYESLLNLLGVAVLLYAGRRFARRLYDGDIAMMYFIWYGSVRTLLEGFRTGNWLIGGVPTAALIGVTVVVIGVVVIVVRHARGWGVPGAFLEDMEAREAEVAAKDMVSEGSPVEPPSTDPPSTEPRAG